MHEVTSTRVLIAYGLILAIIIFFGYLIRKRRDMWEANDRQQAEKRARIHAWRSWRWSQDGWVRTCKLCPKIQYGGDDYSGGPDESGLVQDR